MIRWRILDPPLDHSHSYIFDIFVAKVMFTTFNENF
jgi:hypothetical protein